MKTPEEKLITLGAASGEDLSRARIIISSKLGDDAAWIQTGLDKGWYFARVIQSRGESQYLLVAHVNDQGALHINAVAQLVDKPDSSLLVPGMIAMAREHSCVGIEGVTARRGLVRQLQAAGFQIVGVSVYLPL